MSEEDACMVTGREATWLDDYRDERGLILYPEASRSFTDQSVTGLTKDVAFNRHSMNDADHVSPTDNGKVMVGTDEIRVALTQGIDEEQLKKTLTAAIRATVGLDMSKPLPGDWEHCETFKRWGERRDDFLFSNTEEDVIAERVGCDLHTKHKFRSIAHPESPYLGQKPMEDWEEMLKGGLQTALETQTIVFAVGGASRTATHQLVRSRRAAFHQQSQRASYMGDAPEFRMPESVWVKPESRDRMLKLVMESWRTYTFLCEQDIAYQDARFALLEGTTNFILLEYPIREFLNVYAYRACSMFQWEIVQIMRQCKEVLLEAHPWMEPYVKISCEKTGPAVISTPMSLGMPHQASCDVTRGNPCSCGHAMEVQQTVPHHCTFQGWEDVEGQCDFTWAKQEARTFKPEFHRITREPKS